MLRDRQQTAEFEVNVVRRDSIVFVVTAACVNNFWRDHYAEALRKSLASFELVEPQSAGNSSDSSDSRDSER
jgi:hypothetical protein